MSELIKMSLSDITTSIFDGKHGDCTNQEGSGLYFISVKDLREYDIDYTDAREITPTDFQQNYSRTNLENGDTIYANTGDTIGKSLFVKDNPLVSKTSFQKSVAILKPNTSVIEPRYLYYLLKYETPRLRKASSGSGQKNLLLSTMRSFEVSVHDRLTQKRIVAVLGAIDDKIRNNIHINDNLQHQLKLMYDYWFTQFDFPDENGKPYRASGGAMVWKEQLKREIPLYWSIGTVSDCVEKISTGLNPRDNFVLGNGSIRYITVKNLTTTGSLDFSGCDMIDEEARAIVHRRSDISVGDILFASIAPLGRCYLIQQEPTDWDINESVFSIRSKTDKITPEYLYLFFQSDSFIQKATNTSTGSIFKGIRINTLLDTKMIIPELQVCRSFTSAIKPLLAEINNNSAETARLTALRDWLLPMLMNGQATISD